MTPTEFLAARLDEDEAYGLLDPELNEHARMLREVTAKRGILAAYDGVDDTVDSQQYSPDYYVLGDDVLKALAAIWADHPDYQQEWKP